MNILNISQGLQRFKLFHLLAITSITIQLACNCIVGKLTVFFYGFLPASALVYPICYALGDIIADVYGYSLSRELIWLNIYAQLLFGVIVNLTLFLPSPDFWSFHEHYKAVLVLY
ncbi:VUT family protein [Rickettsiella grylli]|uniref:VUT family protein n=1 Tax=Rickettsiella grylli TaxID=59196 RepID=UPI0000DAE614|nr:VUT family protein [Rickettsiella grylli]